MNLATEENVVVRTEKEQAKVYVEPKGEEGKPAPEPITMVGDRIEMNGKTQEYVATGKPVMVRPTSKLQAKRIRFQVEEDTQDVKVAYAEEDVIFDGQNAKGSLVHATGNNGAFNRVSNEIVLTGAVNASTRDASDEEPIVYQGDRFVYNTLTRKTRLLSDSQAMITIPGGKAPAVGKKPDEASAEKAPAADGKGKDGAEKK
jgi:lipopolysaccharide transport protein LptA